MENLVIEKYPTPIPLRGWDWMARTDGDDIEEAFYGFGHTEWAAVEDMLSKMEVAAVAPVNYGAAP